MRRTILLVPALALMLILAPNAGAIPEATDWEMWCDFDGNESLETYFVATGNSLPGWSLPWSPGDGLSGGIFMGGHQETTLPDGSTIVVAYDPPRGLRSRVTKCRVELMQPADVTFVADPAWIFFPPGAVTP